jgi:hypothetical protein
MASTIRRVRLKEVGVTPTAVTTGSLDSPASGKVWNIPRLYLCNVTAGTISVSLDLYVSATAYHLVKLYALAPYGSLILENIALVNGDNLRVTSSAATSLDAYGSVIEEDE